MNDNLKLLIREIFFFFFQVSKFASHMTATLSKKHYRDLFQFKQAFANLS